MMSLLSLSFSAPWALLLLAGAPLLYLLLRVTPPPPQRIAFPPLKLILDLKKPDATPARTPLWLLILRMALAALVVLAMAGPVLTPRGTPTLRNGPLLLLVDDGWPAASDWTLRLQAAESRLEAAARAGQPAAVLAFSEPPAEAIVAQDAAGALARLRALKPKAFLPSRAPALAPIGAFLAGNPNAQVVWLADGLDAADGRAFAAKLAELAPEAEVLRDPRPVQVIGRVDNGAGALEARIARSALGGAASGRVLAFDAKGAAIGEADFDFANQLNAKAALTLPVQLRNEIARLEIAGENSAGAVHLLDAGSRRRRVGLVAGATGEQPLLSPLHYLRDALSPYADLREAKPGDSDPVGHLLDDGVDVLILADVNAAAPALRARLDAFLASGGTIVRFAGPRLAAGGDDLFPTKLRRGGRTLGGALSWDKPKPLAPFEEASPFFGLTPPAEATVARQVLAEPEEGLPAKTWARLADGTPLVTADKRGPGTLVLFHVSADAGWSNVPLSGLFVEMLKRIVDRAGLVAKPGEAGAEAAAFLPPLRLLDGFGVLGTPPANAKSLPAKGVTAPDADHPAGLYGAASAPRALNAFDPDMPLTPLDISGLKFRLTELAGPRPVDLRGPLLIGAFVLALADALAMLWLGGRWRRQVGPALAALALIFAAPALVSPTPARAEAHSQRDIQAALSTKLAYVITGDSRVDKISGEGLYSLSETLARRTSFVPSEPQGVDPARDELSFYPLLYWPIAPDRPQPGPEVARRIAAYMKQGGMVLFDTRDGGMQFDKGPATPAQRWLQAFLKDIDLPPLEPTPKDHVINRTFYLLDGFVGRTETGPTYIEALPPESEKENRPARAGDGVSPIIIASNDLAAAWAGDQGGDGLYPLSPGGPRQREMALRGGVNIVMYTLTGNYKADQVHVPELLERLGH